MIIQHSDLFAIMRIIIITIMGLGKAEEYGATWGIPFWSTFGQHFFFWCENCARFLKYDKMRPHWCWIWRKLQNAVFQNTKWWLSLKSTSIRGVDSTILKLFEAKHSIWVKHAHPSFSTKFDIILGKCCKKKFVKVLHIAWRKRCQFRLSLFCC